jgi:hypothetical protein
MGVKLDEQNLRVSENRSLKMSESKEKEVAGGWIRLHKQELHKLYASTDIVYMIKSRSMSWAVHIARVREMRNLQKV